jgi:hypothetical protein
LKVTIMKNTAIKLAAILGLVSSMSFAQAPRLCQKITGTGAETILPRDSSPNDPFGRIAGSVTGNFAGAPNVSKTAILTSPPAFSSTATFAIPTPISVREAFVTSPGDSIYANGTSIFTVAPGTQPGETTPALSRCPGPPCVVTVNKILTINGGTGRWANATGQIRELGIGNLNPPAGQGVFVSFVDGEVCLPASSVGALAERQTQ